MATLKGTTVAGNLTPSANASYTLGNTSNQWSAIYGKTGTFSGDVSVAGNLTVAGSVVADELIQDLEDASWATIRNISDSGMASSIWSVGDTKSVAISGTVGTLSVSGTYYVYILGFDHNSTYEGTNRIHFGGFKTSDGVDICLIDSGYGSTYTAGVLYFNMNHWGNYNYGGWAGSDIRYDILGSTDVAPSGYGAVVTTSRVGYSASSTCATSPVSGTLMAALPSALRAVMKSVTKYTDNAATSTHNTSSYVTAFSDYLWLLSEYEVFGTRTYANTYEWNYQAQYTYFINGNSRIKYRHSANTTASIWWLRSPYFNNASHFCRVDTSGSAANRTANYSYGLSPAFAV